MIRCLHLRNLAIVKEATLDLGPGLNLLTGETGAGKSILVDALLLGLGGRAESDAVRTGEERGSVAVEFEVTSPEARAFLEEHGYPLEQGHVVVQREIVASGRGRAFIGGVPAPVADLKAFGALVVSVHGQHQHQTLLDPASHLALLDREGDSAGLLPAMAEASRALAEATARLSSLRDGAQRLAQRADLLRWQLQEIDAAGLERGERETLRAERERLRHAEQILRSGREALEALYEGEGSALARVAEGVRAAREG